MEQYLTYIPRMSLPRKDIEHFKWAVVACDQFTSQPDYWEETNRIVGTSPSTLRLTLPEVYLEAADADKRIEAIHQTMQQYREDGTLETLPAGCILVERFSGGSIPRRGVIIAVDLEAYDYRPGSTSLIRPTEKTVVERIPPRLQIRQGACLELPHIMLLIDDPTCSIIELLFQYTDSLEQVYNTDLMQNGGHINGWFVPKGTVTDTLEARLNTLWDRDVFNNKYHCTNEQPLLPFAVGDGNHSMATAKAHWENLKKTLSPEEQQDHPARYTLVELVNIHQESLQIEPIHRVMFGVEADELLGELTQFYQANNCHAYVTHTAVTAPPNSNAEDSCTTIHSFPFCSAHQTGVLVIEQPKWAIPVATLQTALDTYLTQHPQTKIDYIHGADVTAHLGMQPGNVGFQLPEIAKNDIFRGVVFDGVLPRKTFSMGEAHEKRYYMEAKSIVR